jgi:uncharacterized HAD superfamily protein/hypoxanthine phosphoribosyltransferase
MNFRSFEDMAATIRRELPRLPAHVDIVVGVPRSGLAPALLVALYKNVMATDVEGLFEGRAFAPGSRRLKPRLLREPDAWRDVLVVDDSINSGKTLAELRERLAGDARRWRVTFCAVYGTSRTYSDVDMVLEHCPRPRIFEWNLVHQPDHMRRACVDIDGVLCLDPTKDENDDGPRYETFLSAARPHLVPTVPVATLVTSRLEKYRRQTEEWLHQAGVEFGELCMLDLPSGEERRRLKIHGSFKAEVYSNRPDAILFLESEERQAQQIARMSGKAVICTDTMTLYRDSLLTESRRTLATLRGKIGRRIPLAKRLLSGW